MASIIYNKKTKRYNSLKTAIKNGLYETPKNFNFDFLFIDPTKNKIISQKTALKYFKEGKPVFYDSNNYFYDYLKQKIYTKKPTKPLFNLTYSQQATASKPISKKDFNYLLPNPIIIFQYVEKPNLSTSQNNELRQQQINIIKSNNPGSEVYETFGPIKYIFEKSYSFIVNENNLNGWKVQPVIQNNDNFISVGYNSNFNEALEELEEKIYSIIGDYESSTIYIKNLILSFLLPDPSFIGASSDVKYNSKMEILGNREFRIINTNSYSNCLYHAFVLAENTNKLTTFMNNNDSLINTAKQLKKRLNPTNKILSTFETIQELADYKKRVVKIYDSVLKNNKTFYPSKDNKKPPINIQIVNNHAKALIPWCEIDPTIKFKDDEDEISIKSTQREKSCVIVKHFKPSDYDDKIAVWDIECSPDELGNFKSYALGLAFKDKYYSFWGLDCIKQFIDFLNKNFSYFNGWTFYAHNGGKFDFLLLLREGLLDFKNIIIDSKSLVELNKSFIGVSLLKDDLKINFKDSLRMLPQSLESLCLEFNVKYKKLNETIKHDDINLNNFNSRKIYPLLYLYLRNDCLGLLEVLKTFSFNVYNETKINITTCYTGASLSKKNFFMNYYNKDKQTPIYTLSDDIDDFIRKGYTGGRNEAFKIGRVNGPIYYLDFTSLYPFTGTMKLPYGLPNKSNIEEDKILNIDDLRGKFGFYNVYVRTIDETKKPIHGMKNKNGLFIFPICKNWTLFNGLFTEEIKTGLLNKIYEYKFIEGYEFKCKPFLKDFFNDAFIKKSEAKSKGNKAMALCYKIIANSGYGFWGLRTKSRDGIKLFNNDVSGIIPYILNNKLISYCQFGDYTFLRCYNDLKIKDFNVSISSAISSYARIRLWNAINDIESLGGSVYYCDTDSIMSNLDISKYPDLMNKYMWDGKGDALGCLKNECSDDIMSDLKSLKKYSKDEIKEIYETQLKNDNNFNYFNELIIGGCKFYSLKKTLYTGDIIEVNKLKGYKNDDELCFDLFNNLNNKSINEIQQNQTQFIAPKSFYTSEKDKFRITTKKIPKKFKINYTKGEVKENGDILPLEI